MHWWFMVSALKFIIEFDEFLHWMWVMFDTNTSYYCEIALAWCKLQWAPDSSAKRKIMIIFVYVVKISWFIIQKQWIVFWIGNAMLWWVISITIKNLMLICFVFVFCIAYNFMFNYWNFLVLFNILCSKIEWFSKTEFWGQLNLGINFKFLVENWFLFQ